MTVYNAQAVLEAGLQAIASGESEFDLSGLVVVDSAAVATMLAWQRAAIRAGRQVAFWHLPRNLQNLVDLYDVSGLVNRADTSLGESPARH